MPRPPLAKPGPKLPGKNITHGRRATYNKGCRCLPCRRANAEHAADMRATKRINGEERT